jgi:hypothetical protein
MDRLDPFLTVGVASDDMWKFKTKKIAYNTNEYGYRCNYVTPPNTDYILVAGCSCTFGEALKKEDRYSDLLENYYQLPVLNIGVRGGSPNLIRDNLLQLLSSGCNLPNFIVIQWPNEFRLCIDTFKFGVYNQDRCKELFTNNYLQNFSHISYNHTQWLLNDAKIKAIQFKIWPNTNSIDMPWLPVVDNAIDNKHPGIITNKNIANFIINAGI